MLVISQFVRSLKRKASFSSFQPTHFGRIGLVIHIITTKTPNSINLFQFNRVHFKTDYFHHPALRRNQEAYAKVKKTKKVAV